MNEKVARVMTGAAAMALLFLQVGCGHEEVAVGAGAAPLDHDAPEMYLGEVAPPAGPPSVALPTLATPPPTPIREGTPGARSRNPRRMRLLVLTAMEDDVRYAALRSFLQQIGVPFDTLVATRTDLTADRLQTGETGNYQAVLLTTSNLAYFDGTTWQSALSAEEWRTLWRYEADFGVRQLTYYTFPGYPDDFGLELTGTRSDPTPASFTPAGRALFPYLRTVAEGGGPVPLDIRYAYQYLARPRDATVTPLLTFGDSALLSIKRYDDGRESMTCTFDHNPDLRHSLLLNYGMIHWLTRGVFIGDRQLYLSVHVDDFLIATRTWDPATHAPGEQWYRMTPDDLAYAVDWQGDFGSRHRQARDFKLEMTFNGVGVSYYGATDQLTLNAAVAESHFRWLNHTFTHPDLTSVVFATARSELLRNNAVARGELSLTDYDATSLATGAFTGLQNPEFIRAAYDAGVRTLASNSSIPGMGSPSPNTGRGHPLDGRILMAARRPTNLFYNVSTVAEWVDQYNTTYRAFWGRDLSLDEIIDKDTDVLLGYVLKYDAVPLFVHQANLRALHDGGRTVTLLSAYLEALVGKYEALCNLPLVNISYHEVAQRMRERKTYDDSGVEGVLNPASGEVTLRAAAATRVPVTGVEGEFPERYGASWRSYVALRPGTPVTLPLR